MKIESIIFDLDGVICSTDTYHYLAWKSLADDLGIYFDKQLNNRLRGVSRMASLDILLEQSPKQYTEAEKLSFAQVKNTRYRTLLANMSPADLDPAVSRTLNQLRELGYPMAIGSSSKNAPLILQRIGLGGFFDAVADGNQITRSKPDPEVFLLAARLLSAVPSRTLVVEDAFSGIRAAKAGGFVAAGIGDAAADLEADLTIKALSDLIPLLSR